MKLLFPSLAYARDSSTYLEWVDDRKYPKGSSSYSQQERMAREVEELFVGETRLTGEPYHVHLFRVAIIAGERAGVTDPDTLAACKGHDAREFVEEQIEKGISSPRFKLWTAESGQVEERFGYNVERLIAAATAPRVDHSRSSEESHRIFHDRHASRAKANDRDFFQLRLSDRTDNLHTLTMFMGVERILNKLEETKTEYVPYAQEFNILVPEIMSGIKFGYSLVQPALL